MVTSEGCFDGDLFKRFKAEMAKLDTDPQMVILELTKTEAWALLSQIQLALRHPGNTGHTSEYARRLARRLQEAVANEGAMAEVAEWGWDPQHDV